MKRSNEDGYELGIKRGVSRDMQDPASVQRYNRIRQLELWYRDSLTTFYHQRNAISFLKNYEIGLEIDKVKFEGIKKRYLSYNKSHRKTYENMVIIFFAIVWQEIKDITNVRIDRFIEVCIEMGHSINKKRLLKAFDKLKKTEKKVKKEISPSKIEEKIKNNIKILYQKDLNGIPYENAKDFVYNKFDYQKIKLNMALLADYYLNKMKYDNLINLNKKVFTAGLMYYCGQTIPHKSIYTQKNIEEVSGVSSTSIRNWYKKLKKLFGDPKQT